MPDPRWARVVVRASAPRKASLAVRPWAVWDGVRFVRSGYAQCAHRQTGQGVASCDGRIPRLRLTSPVTAALSTPVEAGGRMIDPAWVFKAREKFFEGSEKPGLSLVPETVINAWHRSKVAGVDPTAVKTGVEVEERPATTLLRAARPGIERLADRLSTTASGS